MRVIKKELCHNGRVLRHADWDRPFILHTDFSSKGISAVLSQADDDGNEYMVCCISRSLNKHERNYASYKGEMLAVVWACKTLRHYLHGSRFVVVSDHQPLKYLMSTPDLTGQYGRWAMALQEFEFEIRHRPGASHANADVPSRYPLATTNDTSGARWDGPSISTPATLSLLASYTTPSYLYGPSSSPSPPPPPVPLGNQRYPPPPSPPPD